MRSFLKKKFSKSPINIFFSQEKIINMIIQNIIIIIIFFLIKQFIFVKKLKFEFAENIIAIYCWYRLRSGFNRWCFFPNSQQITTLASQVLVADAMHFPYWNSSVTQCWGEKRRRSAKEPTSRCVAKSLVKMSSQGRRAYDEYFLHLWRILGLYDVSNRKLLFKIIELFFSRFIN